MFKKIDGFDHYVPQGHAATAVASYLTAANYLMANIATNNFAVVAGSDGAGSALRFTMTASAPTPPSMSYTVETTQPLIVFGFNMRGSGARQRICRINNLIDLDWDESTGRLRVAGDQGPNVIILNAWWYIEVEIDKTAEEIRIWANDTLQLTVDLPGSVANTHTITWGLTSAPSATGTIEIDDFYALDNDTTDAVNVSRRGPITVTTRQPTADVEAAWTIVNSSATNHWEIAAQLDPGRVGAPYLQANIDGRTDKYRSNVVLPNANEIFAVALVSYARKGDLDDRELGMLMETDGGEVEKRVTLTESYRYHQVVFEQAPGGVAWNQNRVETSEFGPVAR